MKIARLSAVVPLALAAGLLSACGASDEPSDATGGVLRFGDSVLDCADPHQRGNNPASYQLKPATDSLLAQDPDTGDYLPWLAKSYSVNDDATRFDFVLRDGVTFSDGTPLDGKAVAQSFDAVVKTLGAAAPLAIGYLNDYVSTEVKSADEIVVKFSKPNIAFLQGTATSNLGIVAPATSKLSADDRCAQGVIGTGPFVIDEFVATQTLKYSKRKDYAWPNPLAKNKGAAYLDGIEIVSVKDTSVLAGSLLSNQIDAYSVALPQDAERIKAAGGHIYTTTNAGYPVSILPNTANPVFEDPAVRKAVQIGFDRKKAIDGVIGDWFQASTSALSSATVGYADQSTLLAYDPAKAEQLLDDAGWKPGSDGIRQKDGTRLTFDVSWEYDWNATSSVLAVIKEQLKEIGVELTINLLPTGKSAAVYESGDYGSRWVNGYTPEPDTLRAVLSVDANNWSARTKAEPLDDLLAGQLQAVDPAKRNAILADVQKSVIEEGYLIPIYDWAQSFVVSSKVKGAQLAYLSGPGPIYSDISLDK
ncbi:ABC transporter substrate-binding protein [Aeromicrobium sp. P5_D10]